MFLMMLFVLLSPTADAGGFSRTFAREASVFDGQLVTAAWLESLADGDFRHLVGAGTCGTWDWSSENGAEQMHGTCVFLELGVPSSRVETGSGVVYRKINTFMLEETPCVGGISEACFHDTYRIVSREITRTDPVVADVFTVDGVEVVMPRSWEAGWRRTSRVYDYDPGVVFRGVEVDPPSLQFAGKVFGVLAVGGSARTTMMWTKEGGVWTDHGVFTAQASKDANAGQSDACDEEARAAAEEFHQSFWGKIAGISDGYWLYACGGDVDCVYDLRVLTGAPDGVRPSGAEVYQDAYDACMEREEVEECEPTPTDPLYDQTDDGGEDPCQ